MVFSFVGLGCINRFADRTRTTAIRAKTDGSSGRDGGPGRVAECRGRSAESESEIWLGFVNDSSRRPPYLDPRLNPWIVEE